MAADFTLMNWDQLQYAGGCNDPVDCIVLSGDARMIETVVVNGETVVKNGRLTKVNEEENGTTQPQWAVSCSPKLLPVSPVSRLTLYDLIFPSDLLK